jgi:hypothetical protein
MVVDLLLKLVDRIIDLAKRREEEAKTYYVNFVAPTFDSFDALHKNYVIKFQGYRNYLQQIPGLHAGDPLFHTLKSAVVFDGHLDSQVRELPVPEDPSPDREFVLAIKSYLNTGFDWASEKNVIPRPVLGPEDVNDEWSLRLVLLDRIRDYPDEPTSRDWAIVALEELLARMQARYAAVVRAHLELKQRLLLPKAVGKASFP